MRLRPVAIAPCLLLALTGVAHADVDTSVQHRFSAGVSTGFTSIGPETGRSTDLAIGIAAGPAAQLRLELGDTEFDSLGRVDRRGSGAVVLDVTRALGWRVASLTPFVEVGLGVTRSLVLETRHWRPHVQGGGGLRVALGARVELTARVQHGIQRQPRVPILLADDPSGLIPSPLINGERERYTRWHLGGSLRF